MSASLDVDKGIIFSSWTTSTRPASPVAGQLGFNTTLGNMEYYDGTSWNSF